MCIRIPGGLSPLLTPLSAGDLPFWQMLRGCLRQGRPCPCLEKFWAAGFQSLKVRDVPEAPGAGWGLSWCQGRPGGCCTKARFIVPPFCSFPGQRPDCGSPLTFSAENLFPVSCCSINTLCARLVPELGLGRGPGGGGRALPMAHRRCRGGEGSLAGTDPGRDGLERRRCCRARLGRDSS